MNFSYRVGLLEARGNEKNIEIVKWYKHRGEDCCFVLAFIKPNKDEDATLESVGLRIWDDIEMIKEFHKTSSDFMMKIYNEEHP